MVRWLPDVLLALLLALVIWCAVASLSMPFGRDQGILAWSAETMLAGGLPYRDAWDVKGPAAPASYALAFFLFGRHESAVRILDLIAICIAGLIYLSFSRRWTGSWRAGAFALCFFFFWTPRNFWDTAQPDLWAGVLVLASAWWLATEERSAARSAIAGALIGAAALVKPLFLCSAAGAAVPFLSRRGRSAFWWLVGGTAVPIVACVLIYVASGSLGSLINVQVHFDLANHATHHSTSPAWFLRHGLEPFSGIRGLAMATLIGIGLFVLQQVDRVSLGPIALNALVSYSLVFVQAKFYPYHFGPTMALLAPMAGLGAARVVDAVQEAATVPRSVLVAIPACALLALASTQAVDAVRATRPWWSYMRGTITHENYVATLDAPYAFPYAELVDAANYVQSHTGPNDPIYLLGFDALLYFEAARPSATRLGYSYPLVSGAWSDIAEARKELMRSLAGGGAALIVVEKNDANNLTGLTGADALLTFPELESLLAAGYEQAYDNATVTIYARRNPGD